MTKKKGIDRIFYLLLILSIGFILFTLFSFHVDDVNISNEEVVTFHEGWEIVINESEQALDSLKTIENNSNPIITNRNRIPDKWKGLALSFRTTDQRLKVFLDDVEVYRFGYDDVKAFGKTPGSAWHFIKIPVELEEGKIEIELTPVYQNSSRNLSTVYVGTKSACILHLIKTNMIDFFISVFLMFFGFSLVVLYFATKRLITNSKNLIYLGIFTILMSLSSMIETRLLQVFVGNQAVFSNGIFLLHMLAPIPIVLYFGETYFIKWQKSCIHLATAFIINYIISMILQVTNILDFMESQAFTQILTGIGCFYFIYRIVCLIRTKKHDIKLIFFYSALSILIISIIMDILCFYLFHAEDVAKYYRVGFFVFILMLGSLDLNRLVALISQGLKTKSILKMAYEDVLTKCKNRIYFEEQFEEAQRNLEMNSMVGVAIFDINNLKKINDYKGHSQGDAMLIQASQLIQTFFDKYAPISRIGGDEFAFVINGINEIQMEETFRQFYNAMRRSLENNKITYDIAYGYAYYNSDIDESLQETFDRADCNMYACKKDMKEINHS